MLIPSADEDGNVSRTSLSREMNANSQRMLGEPLDRLKSIKRDEC